MVARLHQKEVKQSIVAGASVGEALNKKQAVGANNATGSVDFEDENSFAQPLAADTDGTSAAVQPERTVSSAYKSLRSSLGSNSSPRMAIGEAPSEQVPLLNPTDGERAASLWGSDADDFLSSKKDPPGILEQRWLASLRKWRTSSSHGVWSEQLYVVIVICFFAGSSLGAIFIYKTCLTGYQFRFPLTLMVGQMVFAVSVLGIFHLTGYMIIPPLRKQDLLIMAIPTILFTSNIVVGLSALSLVNIPG
jgi:hypothetical protein